MLRPPLLKPLAETQFVTEYAAEHAFFAEHASFSSMECQYWKLSGFLSLADRQVRAQRGQLAVGQRGQSWVPGLCTNRLPPPQQLGIKY